MANKIDGRSRAADPSRLRIDVRVSREEKAELMKAARAAGASLSQWLRDLALRAARRVKEASK